MTFVLVHGSGFAASCWDDVVPLLSEPARAIDLPGRGTHPHPLQELTISVFADAVAEEMVADDLRDAVLVGHSLAGITLPAVVERVPDRIRHVVFVAAAVPPDGKRVVDTLDPDLQDFVVENARQPPQVMDAAMATALFCDGMDEDQRARTLSIMVAEGPDLVLEPVSLAGMERGVTRSWIRLERDIVNPPERQNDAIERLAAQPYSLDAGHMAMITHPEALAALLSAIAAQAAPPT
jgi:pimeloyl-ACP methyl ester carboxylesterase